MEKLLRFLMDLEKAVPPPEDGHHALTHARYGSNETGWEDKLALQVNRNGELHCFFLVGKDMEEPERVISEIVEELSKPTPLNAQLGKSGVRYA